jgi:hypothetical protein
MNNKEMILRHRIIVNADKQDECSLACPYLHKVSSQTYLCNIFGLLNIRQYPQNTNNSMAIRSNKCVKNSTDL